MFIRADVVLCGWRLILAHQNCCNPVKAESTRERSGPPSPVAGHALARVIPVPDNAAVLQPLARLPMPPPCFLSVCLNPVVQKTLVLPRLLEDEVNRSCEQYVEASGKGVNVTRVLTQLGERATHLTQAGGSRRDLFLQLVARDGLKVECVDSGSEIRSCYTLLNRERATCTEIIEEAAPVAPETQARVLDAYSRLVAEHQVVIVSGSKAAGFSDDLFPAMVQTAKLRGALVIVDIRGADLVRSLAYQPDVVKPNFAEFVATFLPGKRQAAHASTGPSVAAVRDQMRQLSQEYGCQVVLTRGEQPTLFAWEGHVAEAAVEPIRVVNSIGSGDAFTAGLASVLGRGGDLLSAVQKGQHCGRLNAACLRPGAIE
jgi:1-phosphofructokinase family hexose kinase